MTIIRPQDAYHKSQMFRLLTEVADDAFLAQELYFKGGTCASMLGYLDRFSVDLDFDLRDEEKTPEIRKHLKDIFKNINLEIKDESPKVLEFLLRYEAPKNERNSLRIDIVGLKYQENKYEPKLLSEIDRVLNCQTKETMFSHKLVAVTERFTKRGSIAGRDIYDVHYFFLNGVKYIPGLIEERTGKDVLQYLQTLNLFIKENITTELLMQDLGTLLPSEKMKMVKNNLLLETTMFVEDEIKRLTNN